MTLKGWRVVKPQHNQSIKPDMPKLLDEWNIVYTLIRYHTVQHFNSVYSIYWNLSAQSLKFGTFTAPCANSADDKLMIHVVYLFFPENMIWHFIQISPLETICMKCQNLFSGKGKKNISVWNVKTFYAKKKKKKKKNRKSSAVNFAWHFKSFPF